MAEHEKLTLSERKSKGLFRESDNKVRCRFCETFFSRPRDCNYHEQIYHKIKRIFSCRFCGEAFTNSNDLKTHFKSHEKKFDTFRLHKSAFNEATVIYRHTIEHQKHFNPDPLAQLSSPNFRLQISDLCVNEIVKRKNVRFYICAQVMFIKVNQDGDVCDKISFVARARDEKLNIMQTKSDVMSTVDNQVKQIDERLQDFQENGSGWILSEVTFIDLGFTTIGDLRGGCYIQYKHKGVLNINSKDNLCLIYCILAHYHSKGFPASERTRSESYQPYLQDIYFSDILFPISLDEIDLLEEKNQHLGFGINVFAETEDKEVFLIRAAKPSNDFSGKMFPFINVLLIEGMNGEQKCNHFVYISNIEVFLRKKLFTATQRTYTNTKFNCQKCFASFYSFNKKEEHEKFCFKGRQSSICFMKKGEKIFFKKPWTKFPHLLCGFVDFESLLPKTEGNGLIFLFLYF